MFLVTGGAGFIGSNLVASLNEAGHGGCSLKS
jgi:nucleoside-diphosphate-sugar epimerase